MKTVPRLLTALDVTAPSSWQVTKYFGRRQENTFVIGVKRDAEWPKNARGRLMLNGRDSLNNVGRPPKPNGRDPLKNIDTPLGLRSNTPPKNTRNPLASHLLLALPEN